MLVIVTRTVSIALVKADTVQTWQLPVGWIVNPDQGSPRRVTSKRLEGASHAVVIEHAGLHDGITYPTTQQFAIEDAQ